MNFFCKFYHLTSLIKQPTCFKNPRETSCIDLTITTNKPKSFQSTCVIETGLFDFHRMIVYFRKPPPTIIRYRNFSNDDNENFINSLIEVLCEDENTEYFLEGPA